MNEPDVLIIGAGPAGLAAGAELGRLGVPAAVLERADGVAASWRGRYDRLRLNTCRWTSTLPGARYPRGTALFPSRDEMVGYLENYAQRNQLDVRLGVSVDRIDRGDGGWALSTPDGTLAARHVIVATGHQHTPRIPDWPGRELYPGRLLHAASYRNPADFAGADVLVAGPGCSGMEIAYDLAVGGAKRVRLAVRTQPNIMLRQSGGLPGELPALALLRLPVRITDPVARIVQRLTVGDLSAWGLTPPQEGLFTRDRREGKAPAIVDKEVIQAIKAGQIEIVAAIASCDETGVLLADETRIQPDVIIAATGYTTGLEPMAGHLGVLDSRGWPQVQGGPAVLPGLRFIGYHPAPGQIGRMGREGRRAAQAIKQEATSTDRAVPAQARVPGTGDGFSSGGRHDRGSEPAVSGVNDPRS